MGKTERKVECDKSPVGMTNKNEFFDAERSGQCIAIGAQAFETQLVIAGGPVRFSLSQLVIADEPGTVGKWIDERAKVLVTQPQTTVQKDNRNSLSHAH